MQISQRITEPALEICPNCEGPIKRIISKNVGILFKGKGFYCKEYSDCLTQTPSGKDGADSSADGMGESADKDYYVVDDSSSKGQDKTPNKSESPEKKPSAGDNKVAAAGATA
jgi:predicted nucleic acid-binding Zn ribbon protein